MSFFHSDSQTDLQLQCNYCIKLQLFVGAQNVVSRLTAVYCMLLQNNPYIVPQHYKEQCLWGLQLL
jgi:hypothetical protein